MAWVGLFLQSYTLLLFSFPSLSWHDSQMKSEDVKCCWLCVSIWSNMSTLPSNHRALLSRWCSELAVCWDMLFSTSEAPFLSSKNGCSNRDLLTRAFIHMFSKNPPWNQSMLMAFVVFCMRGAPHKQLRWLKRSLRGAIFFPTEWPLQAWILFVGVPLACHFHAHKHRRAWAVNHQKCNGPDFMVLDYEDSELRQGQREVEQFEIQLSDKSMTNQSLHTNIEELEQFLPRSSFV